MRVRCAGPRRQHRAHANWRGNRVAQWSMGKQPPTTKTPCAGALRRREARRELWPLLTEARAVSKAETSASPAR